MARSVLFLIVVIWGMSPPALAQDNVDDTAAMLARARVLRSVRTTLIADHLAWTTEVQNATPERFAAYLARYDNAFKEYIARTTSHRASLQKMHDAATKSLRRPQLVIAEIDPLLGLLAPEEAARLAIDLSGEATLINVGPGGIKFDAAESLAIQVGRRASLEIVERLRAPEPPKPEQRDRLLAILRAIEGPAAEAVLRDPIKLPSLPIPKRDLTGLPISFMLVPGLPSPGYEGHDERALVRLSERVRVADPKFSPKELDSDKTIARMLERQRGLGDLSFPEAGMLVTTCAYRRLKMERAFLTGSLGKLRLDADDAGLSPMAKYDGSGDGTFLVQTVDEQYAVVQLLGSSFNREMAICYVVSPRNSEISIQSVPSVLEFAIAERKPDFGELIARDLYVSSRLSWYLAEYREVSESLEAIAKSDSGATAEERNAAISLLGQLRAFKSAETLLELFGNGLAAPTEEAAIESLRRMIPHVRVREAFRTRLAVAKGPTLKRLGEVLRLVEGTGAASSLLESWKLGDD